MAKLLARNKSVIGLNSKQMLLFLEECHIRGAVTRWEKDSGVSRQTLHTYKRDADYYRRIALEAERLAKENT